MHQYNKTGKTLGVDKTWSFCRKQVLLLGYLFFKCKNISGDDRGMA